MKKNALVQLIVIYVGITAMFAGGQILLSNLYFFIDRLIAEGRTYTTRQTEYLAAALIVIGLAFFIIFKSGSISKYITERSGLEDSLTIFTKPNQLLSILIVLIALANLLDHIPAILRDLYLLVTGSLDPGRDGFLSEGAGKKPDWALYFFQILLPCLMIIFCRNLTSYFSKNIVLDDEDMVAEHETIAIEGGESTEAREEQQHDEV